METFPSEGSAVKSAAYGTRALSADAGDGVRALYETAEEERMQMEETVCERCTRPRRRRRCRCRRRCANAVRDRGGGEGAGGGDGSLDIFLAEDKEET